MVPLFLQVLIFYSSCIVADLFFTALPNFDGLNNINYSFNLTAQNFSLDMQSFNDIQHMLQNYSYLFELNTAGEIPLRCSLAKEEIEVTELSPSYISANKDVITHEHTITDINIITGDYVDTRSTRSPEWFMTSFPQNHLKQAEVGRQLMITSGSENMYVSSMCLFAMVFISLINL